MSYPCLPYRLLTLSLPVGFYLTAVATADTQWTGATSADWATASNWTPGLPATGENISIAETPGNGGNLNLDISRGIGAINNGTRTGGFNITTAPANNLTISGGITANSLATGSTFFIRGNVTVATDQTWSNGGNTNAAGDQGLYLREAVTAVAGATGPPVVVAVPAVAGSLALNGNLTKSGVGLLNFAGVTISGPGNLLINEGPVKFNAGSSLPLVVSGPGNITVSNAASLFVYKNSGTMNITRDLIMNDISMLATRNNQVDIASPITWNGIHTLDAAAPTATNLTGAWTGGEFSYVNRIGAGPLNINASSPNFIGLLTVSGTGVTNINAPVFGGEVVVNAAAVLGGEGAIAGPVSLTSSVLSVNPATPGSLQGKNVTLAGVTEVRLTTSPPSTAPFPILSYTGTLTGGVPNLALQAGYRSGVFSTATPGVITLAVAGASRTWNGGLDWDLNLSENWLEGDKKYLQLDEVKFTDIGAGTVTLKGALSPAAVSVNSTADYIFTSTAANYLTGGAAITKSGTGMLTLGVGNTFTGGVIINNGTVKMASDQALGANGNLVTISAGGVLDTNGVIAGNRDYRLVIAGVGKGTGAVVNNSATDNTNGFRTLTLSADATIGGTARWNIRPVAVTPVTAKAVVDLAGHTLTKSSSNWISFVDGTLENPGTININAGTLTFTRMDVSGAGSVNVATGARLAFENFTAGSFTKAVTLNAGNFHVIGAGMVPIAPPITLTGNVDFTAAAGSGVTLNGVISGTGNFLKSDRNGTVANPAAITLAGANTYTGTTEVSKGTLLINGNQAAASGQINVASGATLGGTGTLGGNINAVAGSIIAPGATVGTLTTNSGATLAGSLAVQLSAAGGDRLNVAAALNVSAATLNISVVDSASAPVYVIASYGSLTGNFTAINGLPTGYTLDYNYNGQKQIALVGAGVSNPYGDWETANGIAGAGSGVDSDSDGIKNGIEFVIGGDPSGPGSDSSALLPKITMDATYLNFEFRRATAAIALNPTVQYGNSLAGWTTAVNGTNGVVIPAADANFYGAGIDRVTVKIPRTLANPGTKLFARLNVNVP